MKVLLDTDIGSDIDDAACLAYLLANPVCDLLGITTVTGEAVQRSRIAASICAAAKRRVPIVPGAEHPLRVRQRQPKAQQAVAIPDAYRDLEFPPARAVAFLSETIRRHPGEVTLLAVGPLTNVALLFLRHPEAPALIRGLVLMCGAFDGPAASDARSGSRVRLEWNASGDPHATAVVYNRSIPLLRTVGLDVTERVAMGGRDALRRFDLPILRSVLPYAGVWLESQPRITFHDPLAAVTIFDPAICRFERGEVRVEMEDPAALGATRWIGPEPGGPHEVAVSVDPERFFAAFFDVFPATGSGTEFSTEYTPSQIR